MNNKEERTSACNKNSAKNSNKDRERVQDNKIIDREDFYQSKFDYYKGFTFWVIIMGSLSSVTYFVSDCQLFVRFALETLLPRTIILLPMLLYIILYKITDNYKVLVAASYIMIHLIMWNTIWAIVYLPDRTHANEGFIIMQLLFFGIGFCAPFKVSTPCHILLILDIVLSNLFNHYVNFDLMMTLGIPATLGIIGSQFALQRLYEKHYLMGKELEHLSTMDSLTCAFNRNKINAIVDANHEKFSKELGSTVSVLMFDIDFFKKVNDTYGHISGDNVLKKMADVVKGQISEGDYFIRWGGEEFVLILPGVSIGSALVFAEELRQKVASSDNGVCPITISIGVAGYDGADYKTAIDKADQALYVAKNCGRNCIKYMEY